MFTGIVQELGYVISLAPHATGARLEIGCRSVLADAEIGASIAVNGACLTAVSVHESSFAADLAPETLKRTNLEYLKTNSPVNLERPLSFNGRLDGHFVLGHVDCRAELVSIDALGDNNWWLRIRLPKELERFVVSKGSVAVDGISLTVAEVDGNLASFTIIPHTYQHTTLHSYHAPALVNVEVDILAKHLEKLLGR